MVCSWRKESVKWSLPKGLTLKGEKEAFLVGNYLSDGIEVVEEVFELRPFEGFAAFVE